jgi:hypothetical protein
MARQNSPGLQAWLGLPSASALKVAAEAVIRVSAFESANRAHRSGSCAEPWDTEGRCLRLATPACVPRPRIERNVFGVPHPRRPVKRAMSFQVERFVAFHALKGAAAETRIGQTALNAEILPWVRERGMRLPSDRGAEPL